MASYLGGHTKIFISESGTRWEVPDVPLRQSDSTKRDRWDSEIGVETGRGASKETRFFLSQCAVAFFNDALTDTYPQPPPILKSKFAKLAVTRGGLFPISLG